MHNNENSQGINLPPPVESANSAQEKVTTSTSNPEVASNFTPQATVSPLAISSLTSGLLATTNPPDDSLASQSSVAATAQLVAEDNDLIEKEWVNKAREIVEKTKDDPYKQSEELTLVRADYLKKRYNKIIKTKQ